MPAASAYPTFKTALISQLSARTGLADVNVIGYPPVNKDDLRTTAGAYEAIWIGTAVGPTGPVVFCDGRLRFDEETTVTVVAEVLGQDTRDTQQVVDDRVNELLYELLAELADQSTWDTTTLDLDVFDYFWCEPTETRWEAGRIDGQSTFASRVEVDVALHARRSFT